MFQTSKDRLHKWGDMLLLTPLESNRLWSRNMALDLIVVGLNRPT